MQEKLLEFTIGTNFDKDIVHEITKVNKKGIFTSVFGKLHKDILGGGRASMLLPKISINQLGEYIDLCHKNNLKFNYLANAVCLSNKELIPKYKKKILLFVDGLIKKGIDAITVVSPYLCELFKKK